MNSARLSNIHPGEILRLEFLEPLEITPYQDPSQCSAYTAKRLGGGEAAGDRREQSLNLGLLLNVLLDDGQRRTAT